MDKIFNLGKMVEKEESTIRTSRASEFRKRFTEINDNLDKIQSDLNTNIEEIRKERNK